MQDVFVIGSHSTSFGKKPDQSFKDLTRETYMGLLEDSGLANGDDIEFAYFGNCAMHGAKQGTIRGQVCTIELVDEGLFPKRIPLINVEGACATGSMAFHSAWKDVLSGGSDLAVAIGVEKLFLPKAVKNPEMKKKMMKGFMNGVDNFDIERITDEYERAADFVGHKFQTGVDRSFFMDTYAVQAQMHMKKYGTTQRQIATGAAKNHNFGVDNPLAQYRFPQTVEEVLDDREVSYPLTRSMCAPIGDGSASVLLASESYLRKLPVSVQRRSVRVRASTLSGGYYRDWDEPSLSRVAAKKAYSMSGLTPEQVDVAEVHDACSFCEIYQVEMLGFCEDGDGGPFVGGGETALEGRVPINTSGGLVSKGHPVGATGLSMIHELITQLRGESGVRQVEDARIALQENGGGVIGLEEAACSVVLLESF